LILAALGITGMASETKSTELANTNVTAEANAAPQWQHNRGGHDNRRRARTVRQTRVVRVGRRVYRETYLVTYLPNGRSNTKLISRVRIS
jgi:hypothetical protein